MDDDISSLRIDYDQGGFSASDAGDDPMRLFDDWFRAARTSSAVAEANAMALATSTADGAPSVRMVLLKYVDPARAAFTWFTNLGSRKAREAFAADPARAALAWWWPGDADAPGRQVRASGRVELLDRAAVDAYFASRPIDARIGAAASEQSNPIESRDALEQRAASVGREQERAPNDWGGITLVANELEFWQGRHGRLHDRIVFRRGDAATDAPDYAVDVSDASGSSWKRYRLQP